MPSWFDEGESSSGSPCDVGAVLDSKVPEWVGEIIRNGALVSFGTTRDGGAMSITVTMDGRWRRTYVRTSDEALSWLEEAAAAVAEEAAHASAGNRSRSRRTRAR